MQFSPAAILQPLALSRGSVHVVRDDLLEGGTKQRAAIPFISVLRDQGYREFIYASPFSGFAQIALAVSCRSLGVDCVIFAERDQTDEVGLAHEFTLLAGRHGARIHLAEDLAEAEEVAARYAAKTDDRFKIPLGFDHFEFHRYLVAELKSQWLGFSAKLPQTPRKVWVPLGSGTLGRAFRQAVPREVGIDCVDVHVLAETDPRILSMRKLDNVRIHSAAERFMQPAEMVPPVPSNRYYDAKLWKFVSTYAQDGDVWWNVAR